MSRFRFEVENLMGQFHQRWPLLYTIFRAGIDATVIVYICKIILIKSFDKTAPTCSYGFFQINANQVLCIWNIFVLRSLALILIVFFLGSLLSTLFKKKGKLRHSAITSSICLAITIIVAFKMQAPGLIILVFGLLAFVTMFIGYRVGLVLSYYKL